MDMEATQSFERWRQPTQW